MPLPQLRGAALAVTLATSLLLAPTVHAAPSSPSDIWASVSTWVQQLWNLVDAKNNAGCSMDPDGACIDVEGMGRGPSGAKEGGEPQHWPMPAWLEDAGCSIDPHGGPLCAGQQGDAGMIIDPSG